MCITIEGEGADVTTIQGTGTDPVVQEDFLEDYTEGFTIKEFTITGGTEGIQIYSAKMTLEDA